MAELRAPELLKAVMELRSAHDVAVTLEENRAREAQQAAANAGLTDEEKEIRAGVEAITSLLNELCPRCRHARHAHRRVCTCGSRD